MYLASLLLLGPLLVDAAKTEYLRATALITNAANHSILQCWEFTSPFTQTSEPGIQGSKILDLANVTDVTYTVLPAHFHGGLHTAPVPQIVSFVSGKARITLPHSPATAEIVGGANGLIVAADTRGDGHYTDYPSSEQTIALAIPFQNGKIPHYRVLREHTACPSGSQIVPALDSKRWHDEI